MTKRFGDVLGEIFPSDIMSLDARHREETPRFRIYYVYKNKARSYYFPVAQEHLSEALRTWYFGIEIDWYFSIYLPTDTNQLYTFRLKSEPAPQFSAQASDAGSVYENMAESAYADFGSVLRQKFIQN